MAGVVDSSSARRTDSDSWMNGVRRRGYWIRGSVLRGSLPGAPQGQGHYPHDTLQARRQMIKMVLGIFGLNLSRKTFDLIKLV